MVYGEATGTSPKLTRFFNKLLHDPKLTIVLLGDRKDQKNVDSYESNSSLQENVKKLYSEQVNNKDVVGVQSNGTPNIVFINLLKVLYK